MSDKLDILIGMIERLEEKTERKLDDLSGKITKLSLDLKIIELRHDECPGDVALVKVQSMEKQTEGLRYFMSRPKMFLYVAIGFVTVGVLSALISWGTVKYVREDDGKDFIKIERKHGS